MIASRASLLNSIPVQRRLDESDERGNQETERTRGVEDHTMFCTNTHFSGNGPVKDDWIKVINKDINEVNIEAGHTICSLGADAGLAYLREELKGRTA